MSFELEAKEISADGLLWDISYKEQNSLFRHNGESIFKGLVSEFDPTSHITTSVRGGFGEVLGPGEVWGGLERLGPLENVGKKSTE